MEKPGAVAVRNLSKKFRLFRSPRERLLEAVHPFQKKYHREFWALRDVTLEVPRGSTVAIIGRNGSGKSTLLQIICGVLRPTAGEVEVNGRVSALLELGAGFNPEFTGRENVLFKGRMLGVPKEEMLDRLPRIEEFADIGEFFDQPVKTYSSGMFVRLAFAAAINVDPEILVVDEALAVGDAKFQYKCYQKIHEFQAAGKTILLVTHNMDAVVKHCDRAVLLERGSILESGDPSQVANSYYELLFTGKLSSYSAAPVLVERECQGFNIVHYRKRYIAISVSLGPVDLTRQTEEDLARLQAEKKCALAGSLEELKRIIRGLSGQKAGSAPGAALEKAADSRAEMRRKALERFLQESPSSDLCPRRRSYNRNEHRFGDRRAELADYLVLSGDAEDPVHLRSGETADIFLKARFLQAVNSPMFGFSLKTTDGVVVYAGNTRYFNLALKPAGAGEAIVFRFSLRLSLHPGDYFIDLGVAEMMPDRDVLNDVRYGLIHLVIQHRSRFDGLADLEATCGEAGRIPCAAAAPAASK